MKIFLFDYTATYRQCIQVIAENREEAIDKANDMIDNNEVVLGPDNLEDCYLDLIEESE